MRLVLINPPFTFLRRSEVISSQCLGLLYIAAYARSKGHRVQVIDATREGSQQMARLPGGALRVGLSDAEIVARIPVDVDVIGISAPFSHLAPLVHGLIEQIKLAYPSTPIVMGGVHPSTQPAMALESRADFIVLGEGEVPFVELVEHLESRGERPLPDGVVPRRAPDLLREVSAFHVKDFEALPRPARDLVDFERYVHVSARNTRGWRSASILTSRGCPFDCEFCSVHPVCGYQWRPRAPRSVLDEIDELVECYGVDLVEIEDDNFTLKADRAQEVLEGIEERNRRGTRLAWQALNGLRVDSLTEKLIAQMARSNCHRICLALEHGDAEVLKSMNKRLSLAKVREVAGWVAKHDIPCSVFAIYGYPGETRERFEKSMAYYQELKQVAPGLRFVFFVAQPYPGTQLYKRAVREGWIGEDAFSSVHNMGHFSTARNVWLQTPDFDHAEVRRRGAVLRKRLFSRSELLRYQMEQVLPGGLVDPLRTLYHAGKKFFFRGSERRVLEGRATGQGSGGAEGVEAAGAMEETGVR